MPNVRLPDPEQLARSVADAPEMGRRRRLALRIGAVAACVALVGALVATGGGADADDCAGAADWFHGSMVRNANELLAIDETHPLFMTASSGERTLSDSDRSTLRDAGDDVAILAREQRDSSPPGAAKGVSDRLAAGFDETSDALLTLAAADSLTDADIAAFLRRTGDAGSDGETDDAAMQAFIAGCNLGEEPRSEGAIACHDVAVLRDSTWYFSLLSSFYSAIGELSALDGYMESYDLDGVAGTADSLEMAADDILAMTVPNSMEAIDLTYAQEMLFRNEAAAIDLILVGDSEGLPAAMDAVDAAEADWYAAQAALEQPCQALADE